ncbi:MAG: universal stress protein [Nitrospiraceae bacterium]|jgi:nucleotide-binding universal stress UspA family protein|nr:universal stress protein [Nitrospiraceae bacterium]
MTSKPSATTISRENTLLQKILIAVDGSEHSARALHYVGMLLRDTRDAQVTLFHVLKPMPRELLEHGGSEDPAEEVRLAKKLQEAQEDWVRTESRFEHPILLTALELFGKTGFPLDRVTLKFGHEDDIAHTILDEARTGGYGTIVVSRQDSNRMKRFFGGGVTDQLLREASGYTLWVVE